MQAAKIDVLGCDPTPPDFRALSKAFGIPYFKCTSNSIDVTHAMTEACNIQGPSLIDVHVPNLSKSI